MFFFYISESFFQLEDALASGSISPNLGQHCKIFINLSKVLFLLLFEVSCCSGMKASSSLNVLPISKSSSTCTSSSDGESNPLVESLLSVLLLLLDDGVLLLFLDPVSLKRDFILSTASGSPKSVSSPWIYHALPASAAKSNYSQLVPGSTSWVCLLRVQKT